MEISSDIMDQRVALGAAWLDEKRPGWRDQISLTELRMEQCAKCVLGQVFSDFAHVYEWGEGYRYALNRLMPSTSGPQSFAVEHGFNLPCLDACEVEDFEVREDQWLALRDAWVRLIEGRDEDRIATRVEWFAGMAGRL